MTKQLFDDFPEVSSKQWKQLIQVDLKGADYNDTLVWESTDGIHVKPFYHADEAHANETLHLADPKPWTIAQSIYVGDVAKSNAKAKKAIALGAESIRFILPTDSVMLADLLAEINLENVSIILDCLVLSPNLSQQMEALSHKASIHLSYDIVGQLAKTGNWFNNLKGDFSNWEKVLVAQNACTVQTDIYQNAGANNVQQLAYALAHANEYLNHLEHSKSDQTLDKSKFKFHFNVAVGSNYFFEIAKLRALRVLWSRLAEAYGYNTECFIYATPTRRNKTLYDYNTNMLRTTTECMSAVLGGADTICNTPYDAIYHKDNNFGERIARNQLLILKHESYFDKVLNPSDGSYYIETLTAQLADKALELFKSIETSGGFLSQLKEGLIQKKIKENASKEQELFDSGKEILLGTNKHPNPDDRMKHELELYPFVKKNPIKTLIAPIIGKRLAEDIEQKRLQDE